jgi:hypothetical protein
LSQRAHDHISLPDGSGTLQITQVKVILRPTFSRPICPGVRPQSGPVTNFPFEVFLRQLRICYFLAPSPTTGRVCNLLLLLGLASAVPLGSESRGPQDHILLSKFFGLPQFGGVGPRTYIPQELGGPAIPQGTGFLLTNRRSTVKVF